MRIARHGSGASSASEDKCREELYQQVRPALAGRLTVHIALREIVAFSRFKKLMKKHAGKLKFAGHDR